LRSISCREIALKVLEACIAGNPPRKLPPSLIEEPCGPGLFGTLAEGLADRFEPALCDAYVRLFAQAVEYAHPNVDAASLVARYQQVRKPRAIAGKPHRIYVLSRVTLGADVAVTSVMLAAAKRRFPHAEVFLVGPSKNSELFAADSHLHHAPVEFRRGGLRERLKVWPDLKALLDAPGVVVIDPDSRLTQLGLLPVGSEERYHLFESRAYGGDSTAPLPELAARWAMETFGGPPAKPYVALGPPPKRQPYIAVSLGVGENAAKRLADPFEERLLALIAARGLPVCVDRGAGGEEAERVARAVERSGAAATFWEGSFAGFARIIAGAALYAGYDSAGQHVAAACGVPLISVFAGFPAERMFHRWRPCSGSVIRVDQPDVDATLARVETALASLAS
jgi:ADP-heptose:LPS heptosyltransferase